MPLPYKLNEGTSKPAGVPRDTSGRFARPDATPATPLQDAKPASNDQQVMSGWAPKIGQNSATMKSEQIPFKPISQSKGFKVS
jgi:hypothetical protein